MQNSLVKVSRRYNHPCFPSSTWKVNSWMNLTIQVMCIFQRLLTTTASKGNAWRKRLCIRDHSQSIETIPVQYQAIQTRTNHKEVQRIQAGDRPGARTYPPADEAATQGPSFTGPITRARARMMAQAGQTRDNPPPS